MAIISNAALHVAAYPFAFVLQTLRGFRKNQGMLLAGAIAYYALLSIVPVLILSVIVLSRFVDQADLLILLGRSPGWSRTRPTQCSPTSRAFSPTASPSAASS
jgi:hypothetical protein